MGQIIGKVKHIRIVFCCRYIEYKAVADQNETLHSYS